VVPPLSKRFLSREHVSRERFPFSRYINPLLKTPPSFGYKKSSDLISGDHSKFLAPLLLDKHFFSNRFFLIFGVLFFEVVSPQVCSLRMVFVIPQQILSLTRRAKDGLPTFSTPATVFSAEPRLEPSPDIPLSLQEAVGLHKIFLFSFKVVESFSPLFCLSGSFQKPLQGPSFEFSSFLPRFPPAF